MKILLLLCAVVFAAAHSLPAQEPDEQLELDRLRAGRYGTRTGMITVIAQFSDGSPARGTINCNGYWCKFDEQQYCGPNLPFVTDSRGACIFNPGIEDFDEDVVEPTTCYATSGTRSGRLSFRPINGSTYVITIPGSAKK